MNTVNLFGQRLKELREERNLTTREFAEIFHTTAPTISRYETGVHDPKRAFIQVVANHFSVNPAWLAGQSTDKYTVDSNPCVRVPILGTIAAGTPILSDSNYEGYEWICDHEKVDFCLKVKGNSMIGARIYDGDIVFIRKQESVENGEIAVVIIEDEATLKRVYVINGNVILKAENPEYKDLVFTKKDRKHIKIIGKAVMFKGVIK